MHPSLKRSGKSKVIETNKESQFDELNAMMTGVTTID